MSSFPRQFFRSFPLAAAVAALACGGESLVVPPTTGTLQVTSSTSGPDLDADGYIVTVDGSDHGAIPAVGTVSVEALAAGDHVAGLSGVAGNCQVQGDNPRTVVVTAGATATAAFTVVCTAPPANPGSILISTVTTGPNPDVNGYAFTVDAGTGQPIGPNTSTTVGNLSAGDHTVGLSGIAGNCSVGDANPRPVTVSAGGTVDVIFSITCTASTGSILVTTVTTGLNPDDGYSVKVDDGAARNVGGNATTTFDAIGSGTHNVRLSGVAANCAAGDNPQQVVVLAGQAATAAFSISCTAAAQARIAFVRGDLEAGDLFTVNPDGTDRRRLTDGRTGLADNPQWSPDRSKIVFEGGPSGGEIYVINADGNGLINLTRTPTGEGGALETGPKWSPDGNRILFAKTTIIPGDNFDQELTDLYTMSADGGSQAQLTHTGSEAGTGGYAWSPDGSQIAFGSERNGAPLNIYLMRADGSGPQQLTHAGISFAPNWSPDGRRITYLGQRGAVVEVWAINTDGTGEGSLTNQGRDSRDPTWSPDGSKIVYMSASSTGISDIWTVNADGNGEFNVTSNGADNSYPVWSPDGRQIAFVVDHGVSVDAPRVWVVSAEGSGPRDVSKLAGYRPDW